MKIEHAPQETAWLRRNVETASGNTSPAMRGGMPNVRSAPSIIAGSAASDDRVDAPTACAGAKPRTTWRGESPPSSAGTGERGADPTMSAGGAGRGKKP